MLDTLETEETTAMKYVPLAHITGKGTVKLKLMGTGFEELCNVMGNALASLNETWEADPWLTLETAEARAAGRLLLDIYETYLERYAVRKAPAVVSISLSQCEANVFWKVLMLYHPPRETHPAFTALMSELHQVLS